MGIFGNLGGLVGDVVARNGGAEAMVRTALQQAGGLQGIVGKLRSAGYGDQVQSWLGAGPNQPVTGDGIARAIGQGPIGEMAQRYGLQPDQLSGLLAHVLPGLVDRLSPNGVIGPHPAGEARATGSPLPRP